MSFILIDIHSFVIHSINHFIHFIQLLSFINIIHIRSSISYKYFILYVHVKLDLSQLIKAHHYHSHGARQVIPAAHVTVSADIWSLGCCIYEFCEGKKLFRPEKLGESLQISQSESSVAQLLKDWNKHYQHQLPKNLHFPCSRILSLPLKWRAFAWSCTNPSRYNRPQDVAALAYRTCGVSQEEESLILACRLQLCFFSNIKLRFVTCIK